MNFKLGIASIAAAAALSFSLTAQAGTILINFDGVATGADVNQFYNGGTDSFGNIGVNFGVAFYGFTTTSGFGETSQPNLAYNNTNPAIGDVAVGFTGLSFTDGVFSPSTVSVYSGLNGTGTLLGSTVISGNPYAFSADSVAFSGTAQSFTLSAEGGQGQAGLDNLSIAAVPEPETYAMLLAGLGLMGFMVRRKKTA